MKKIKNSAADVQGLAANHETTKKGKAYMAHVDINYVFGILLGEYQREKRINECYSTKELDYNDLGFIGVTKAIVHKILYDVQENGLDVDVEKLSYNIKSKEGHIQFKVDYLFQENLYHGEKMFLAAMDSYLHEQLTCNMMICGIMKKKLEISYHGCELAGYDDEDYPFYTISFSWVIKDREDEESYDVTEEKYIDALY